MWLVCALTVPVYGSFMRLAVVPVLEDCRLFFCYERDIVFVCMCCVAAPGVVPDGTAARCGGGPRQCAGGGTCARGAGGGYGAGAGASAAGGGNGARLVVAPRK